MVRKPQPPKPVKFTMPDGSDIMGGPKIVTQPPTLKPPFVPGTGMGLGMEKRPYGRTH